MDDNSEFMAGIKVCIYVAVRDSAAGQPEGAAKAPRTLPNAGPPPPE
jgi:hypothetical protein